MSAAVVRRHRRHGALLLALGMVCALTSAFLWRVSAPAHADPSFSSFDLQAGARGWRFYDEDSANGNQEGEVPESSTDLAQGPVGYGLSSVVWPGPTASNAGTLVLVLRPDAPPQSKALNNPIRAEAHTGQGNGTTKNDSVPGTSMSATALADRVEAQAVVNSSSGPGTFGPTHTHALSSFEGPLGKGTADSLVQNINLAAGVVKIDSVSSTAVATTDGTKSDGEAHTTVNGLTIGGQPATIDEHGLHIGAQNEPANAVANQLAQQALGKSGTTITMGAPTREVNGATTTVTAGALVVSWNTGSGTIFTVTIGGATATVTAAPGTDASPAPADSGGGGGSVATPVDTGSGSLPSPSGGTSTGVTPAATPSTPLTPGRAPVAAPKLALARSPRVLSPGAVVFAAFAAGLMGFGMRRLGDGILAEPTAAVCPLAEDD